jgi:hypothetical protein
VKVSINVCKKDFKFIKHGNILSQIAAYYKIKNFDDDAKLMKDLSLKY